MLDIPESRPASRLDELGQILNSEKKVSIAQHILSSSGVFSSQELRRSLKQRISFNSDSDGGLSSRVRAATLATSSGAGFVNVQQAVGGQQDLGVAAENKFLAEVETHRDGHVLPGLKLKEGATRRQTASWVECPGVLESKAGSITVLVKLYYHDIAYGIDAAVF